jgi:hypothetical protein
LNWKYLQQLKETLNPNPLKDNNMSDETTFPNWTLAEWSRQICVPVETIRRGLVAAGIPTRNGRRYKASAIARALRDPLEEQKIRATRAKADLAEQQLERRKRDLLPRAQVEGYVTEILDACRQYVKGLPDAMAATCNPADPTLAREALRVWVTEFLDANRPRPVAGAAAGTIVPKSEVTGGGK